MSSLFDTIPTAIKDKLIKAGYDSLAALPSDSTESSRWLWDRLMARCGLSDPEMNKMINAVFPKTNAPQGAKSITLLLPSVEDEDVVLKQSVFFADEKNYSDFCRANKGWIRRWDDEKEMEVVLSYPLIEDGGVYAMGGEFYRAMVDGKLYRRVFEKVFEHESGLAVQREVGADSHLHDNVILDNNGEKREIDGIIVHKGGEGVANSTAYIIEAQIAPPMEKIDKLVNKVELFQKYIPSFPHFNSVRAVVPVLAGKHWNKDVAYACSTRKIWRVAPSDSGGFKIIRALHTLAQKLKK